MMVYVSLLCSVVLGAFGQIFMKEAMRAVGPFPGFTTVPDLLFFYVKAVVSLPMFAAVGCYGLSFVLWLGVLSHADLSFARPFVSLGYVIVIIYGFYTGENMTGERLLGIALIIGGLFFVARSAAGT